MQKMSLKRRISHLSQPVTRIYKEELISLHTNSPSVTQFILCLAQLNRSNNYLSVIIIIYPLTEHQILSKSILLTLSPRCRLPFGDAIIQRENV